jgi:xanthine dehydrogenase YagT iron-sulfur-binding subunit
MCSVWFSRHLPTDESAADEGYRAALFSEAANHTVMTRAISGRPARCLANRFTAFGTGVMPNDIPSYPIALHSDMPDLCRRYSRDPRSKSTVEPSNEGLPGNVGSDRRRCSRSGHDMKPLHISKQPADEAFAMATVRLTVNGQVRQLELDPRQSLLDVLRERLDLTGTKKGCNQGACGACTVLLNGRRILSCLTLAAMHDGAKVETVEGLAKGDELHPLQAAFIAHDGLQCGFCTPGQIMSGLGCIAEGHAGSPEEIRFWMSGNICRCGAYPGIVAAISDAAGGA